MSLAVAVCFPETDLARLDDEGARLPPGSTGLHDAFMEGHVARRDKIATALAERSPGEAGRFVTQANAFARSLSRRAMAMESFAAGETISAGLGTALKTAVRTVRANPAPHDDIRDGFLAPLRAMAEAGMAPEALTDFAAKAERSLAAAAVNGLIDQGDIEEARRALAGAEETALVPEDLEGLTARADRVEAGMEAGLSAETAAAGDAY